MPSRPSVRLRTWPPGPSGAAPDPNRPAWTLTASPYTPSSLLAGLSENLAYGTGTHQGPSTSRERRTSLAATPPGVPAVKASPAASRTR
ncbi:DUF317 domain-containing protein [Streptomyces sp. NBC_01102]|uniref:DUF317 domain-containing protein n=1 Tax=Streptomyces sp. NBC_01102 TaxID=2903749 RepID=UPI003863D833